MNFVIQFVCNFISGDGGTYWCHAENSLGEHFVTAEVSVRDPEEKGAAKRRELEAKA